MRAPGADRLPANCANCGQCWGMDGYQSCFLDTRAQLRAEFDAPTELRQRLADKLKAQGCGCWETVRGES